MSFAVFLRAALAAVWLLPVMAQASPVPPAEPRVEAHDLHSEWSEALLQQVPGPLWLPSWLPEGYRLLDLRLHQQYDAHLGPQMGYTLIYGNGQQSLMLHSRLPGYSSETRLCRQPVLHQQQTGGPAARQGPRELLLIAPACSLSGEALSVTGPSAAEAARIWQRLRLRKSPGA